MKEIYNLKFYLKTQPEKMQIGGYKPSLVLTVRCTNILDGIFWNLKWWIMENKNNLQNALLIPVHIQNEGE